MAFCGGCRNFFTGDVIPFMDVLYDSEHDMANAMKKMFDPFERIARSKHYCPCCKRGFNPEEEDDFVKKVSLSI